VYLNDPVLHDDKPQKLAPIWAGPFEILQVVTPHSVKLRDLISQRELPNDIHVDRLKKCWSSREYFLSSQTVKSDPVGIPENILEQRGTINNPKYLVQYRIDEDGSRPPDRWLRTSEIPSSLVMEWIQLHCKDGKLRKRLTKTTGTPVQSSDSETLISESEIDSNTSVHEDKKPTKTLKPGTVKQTEVSILQKTATRRSPRLLARKDYRECDSDEFE
jgi:hypothetical protein